MDKWKKPVKITSIILSALSAIGGLMLMVLSVFFIAIPSFLIVYVIYNVFIVYMGDGAEWLFVLLLWFSPLVLGCLFAGISMFFYGVLAIIFAIVILVGALIIIKTVGSKKEIEEC